MGDARVVFLAVVVDTPDEHVVDYCFELVGLRSVSLRFGLDLEFLKELRGVDDYESYLH